MRTNCEQCGVVRRLADLIAVPNGKFTMMVVCREHLEEEE